MPDRNGRLTADEIVELIEEGETVEVEFTTSHAGTILSFGRHAITVDPGKKEQVFTPAKAIEIGRAFIAWGETKRERSLPHANDT